MEKLLITCIGDGPLRAYVSQHRNFEETFPGEFVSINDVDAYGGICWLINRFRPNKVRIQRYDSHLVELFVKEDK